MKRKWLPDWVSEFKDRHGKKRYRFRRKGYKQYLFKNLPGTEGFLEEYAACLSGACADQIRAGASQVIAGTFDSLIAQYYRSPLFLDPGARTQVIYRGVLERWRAKYGKCLVRDLETKHVSVMLAEMMPHRTAANMLRKRLRVLMTFAIEQGYRKDNPVLGAKRYTVKSAGFHTWTEQEIAQFELRHPVGSKARLALDLMLWTGQRISDARIMGPTNVQRDRLVVVQKKTGVEVSLPILPPLAESILATRSGALVFMLSEHGKPYSEKGFGNKMRQWCDEAGLPHCSAHGLRKAAARRLAEAGCTNQEIKAWTGHMTDSEVSRYTRDASNVVMSDVGGKRLMANHAPRLAIGSNKPLKMEA